MADLKNMTISEISDFMESIDEKRFRGRQVTHNDLGHDVFNAFLELVKDYAQVDKAAKMEGRNLIMILMPKAQK